MSMHCGISLALQIISSVDMLKHVMIEFVFDNVIYNLKGNNKYFA